MAVITINFKSGIKKIHKIIHPNLSLTKKALELINRCINNVNSKLVNEVLGKHAVMEVQTTATAVRGMFGEKMKKFAESEGNRALLNHAVGVLDYSPTQMSLRRKKGKSKRKDPKIYAGPKFAKGFGNLKHIIFPDAYLSSPAKATLCDLLGKVAIIIADDAETTASAPRTMTVHDIKNACDRLLPQELREHALAEGSKMIYFLETGSLTFAKERKRTRAKSATKSPSPKRRKVQVTKKTPRRKVGRSSVRKGIPSSKRKSPISRKRSKSKVSRKKAAPKVSRKKAGTRKKVSPTLSRKKVARKGSRKKTVPKASRRKAPKNISRKVAKEPEVKTPNRKIPKRSMKPSSKKPSVKKLTDAIIVKAIERGVRDLNPQNQKLSTDTIKLISNSLAEASERIVDAIKSVKTSTVGPKQIRSAVTKVFPREIRKHAYARIGQVILML